MTGDTKFSGSAPRGSKVEIVDADGKLLATTTADESGDWIVPCVGLPIGQHKIHASALTPRGHRTASPSVLVTIEAPEPGDDDGLSERAESYYWEMVQAAARGETIDRAYGELLLEATGRTVERYNIDVDHWQEVLRRGIVAIELLEERLLYAH